MSVCESHESSHESHESQLLCHFLRLLGEASADLHHRVALQNAEDIARHSDAARQRRQQRQRRQEGGPGGGPGPRSGAWRAIPRRDTTLCPENPLPWLEDAASLPRILTNLAPGPPPTRPTLLLRPPIAPADDSDGGPPSPVGSDESPLTPVLLDPSPRPSLDPCGEAAAALGAGARGRNDGRTPGLGAWRVEGGAFPTMHRSRSQGRPLAMGFTWGDVGTRRGFGKSTSLPAIDPPRQSSGPAPPARQSASSLQGRFVPLVEETPRGDNLKTHPA
uniref:Translation initiation factor IF-2-like n=1 Tax=Petromyzon marinus TaxID=7757 RepID=A0AAJ7XHA0_PETMA|nr:translation initiation factor IF-2-like [Petromyzon marinus]